MAKLWKGNYFENTLLIPVSVDLRVSRIYRHLAISPSFEGQIAGAGGTPRLSYLPFQTMEMPLDGDKYDWLLNLQTLVTSEGWKIQIIGAKIDAPTQHSARSNFYIDVRFCALFIYHVCKWMLQFLKKFSKSQEVNSPFTFAHFCQHFRRIK